MKKIVALGASNSSRSINRQLAGWAAQESGFSFELLDLNDFEMPIFSIDREEKSGFPEEAIAFKKLISEADGLIFSMAEHNGAYSAAFKNIMDWISRLEKGIWSYKPMLLLATSPGGRGAKSVLEIAEASFPRRGAEVIASFSLPSFNDNFNEDQGITDETLLKEFTGKLAALKKAVLES
jgi:NAD(P)H-dependent FMN reductase